MVMRRYISHLFTWVISFLTLLAFSSCFNEHPKEQLDGGGSNGSASEIFDTTIAPLYDFMGGAIEGKASAIFSVWIVCFLFLLMMSSFILPGNIFIGLSACATSR